MMGEGQGEGRRLFRSGHSIVDLQNIGKQKTKEERRIDMGRLSVLTIILALMSVAFSAPAMGQNYVGSESCFTCHPEQYNDWKASGHPYKLRPASQAKFAALPLPEGYSWDDISYVIGGHKWKARFVNKKGYIITTDKEGNAMPTQWNIRSGKWVNYHAGEKKPYTCGSCHTTGFSKEGHQGGLEGIGGTWASPGIQCEACHGPGGEHVKEGEAEKIKKITSSALCGNCHIRGAKDKIPFKGGFIRHHEQYNEYLASPHAKKLQCTSCHDPHKPARFGIKAGCESCHSKQAEDYKGSSMQKSGVRCIECHMPRASKSAEAWGPKEGDVRTHNFKISTDPNASMATPDGKYATGVVTLDFVCLNCHGGRDIKWAARYAKKIHIYGK
jgi:hypothetical protein